MDGQYHDSTTHKSSYVRRRNIQVTKDPSACPDKVRCILNDLMIIHI